MISDSDDKPQAGKILAHSLLPGQPEENAKADDHQAESLPISKVSEAPAIDRNPEAKFLVTITENDNSRGNEAEQAALKNLSKAQEDKKEKLKTVETAVIFENAELNQSDLDASSSALEDEKSNLSWQEKLIEEVFADDQAQYDKDREELTAYWEDIKHWQERTSSLLKHLQTTNQVCQNSLNDCNEAYQSLSEELQDKLKGRQDGLELIRKMLERLLEQMQAIADKSENLDIPQKLPEPNKEAIAEVVNQQADKDLAPKAIKQKLKTIGNERWQIVSKNREEAKSQQKKWLQFVDRKILPILDGIDDGKKYSEQLIEELKNQYSKDQENLESWFKTYDQLREELIDMLEKVQVYLMEIEVGKPVDYNRHEPFDVQFDEEKDAESVKEIVRQGYEYTAPINAKEKLVLRPAQVVVVKKN